MAPAKQSKTEVKDRDAEKAATRERVRAHRAKLRAQGLRPVQYWLPDVNSPEFIAEARRQGLAVSRSPHAQEDQDFVNAIQEWGDD